MGRRARCVGLWVWVGLGAPACDSAVQDPGGAGGSGGGSGTACPGSLPVSGEPCSIEALFCTYGIDARPSCRSHSTCGGGVWNSVVVTCEPPPTEICPIHTPPDGEGCPQDGAMCVYGGGVLCECSSCLGGPCMPPPPVWACAGPETGCPVHAPNAGEACNQPGQRCHYGTQCGLTGVTALCDQHQGMWTWEAEICPL